ncbi:MAG: GIY-YIG nuclease family protein, partial [Prolixibacteraceae bacterium]|nr:GIY-YIG nuclease family protein [Prolixibacteraceae bacterium]
MKAFAYILFSEKLNRFYVGSTHESIEQRLEKHNQHSYGNHRFTATT